VRRVRAAVGLYKFNLDDFELESAWFQPYLNLQCDVLVSKFALSNATCTATLRCGGGGRQQHRAHVVAAPCFLRVSSVVAYPY
jgi:hypothetical protein